MAKKKGKMLRRTIIRRKKAKSPTGKPSKVRPEVRDMQTGGGSRTSEYTAKKKKKKQQRRGTIGEVITERATRAKKY